jgi:two-component system sensor histidine kinase DegS
MNTVKTNKPIVFYLDDDEFNLILFKANLEEHYEVIVEQEPNKAIKYLSENQVDVILTDQIMPHMDGIEFLKKISNIQSEVSRILLTGVVNQEVMLKAINQVQIYRFHEKSSNFDALKFDIDNAFQMVQAIRQKDYYHKQMLEAMEKNRLISENVPAQIIQTDINGVIIEISKDFGAVKTKDIGTNIIEFLPEDEVKSFIEAMSSVKETKENVTIVTRAFDFYKNYNWHSTLIGSLTSNNAVTGFLMVSHDITERINSEEKIMSAVIEAEDLQKSRIARDIHDGLQQTLTIALMNFEAMGNVFELLDTQKSEKFLRGFQHLEKGLHETRNIAYSLIPKSVEDFGYIETVINLIEELNHTTATKFKFYTNLKKRINSQNIEYNLFRITQESINNIIKYAKANEVFIQLVLLDKILQLTIEDDGVGFDVKEKLKSGARNFGLFNMRKRTESLSGKMIIDSDHDNGTLIYVELPLKNVY